MTPRRSAGGPPRRIHSKRFPRAVARPLSPAFLGGYALLATAHGRLDRVQLESARKVVRRRLRRSGSLRLVVFPTLPLTRKPLQSRMGRGKGRLAGQFCWVRPGQSLLVLTQVSPARARLALAGGASKLPLPTRFFPLRVCQG